MFTPGQHAFRILAALQAKAMPRKENGEMAEWSKARAWKVRIPVKGYRGFESLSLRHCMAGGEAAHALVLAASQACLGARTTPTHQGRNGLGHAMKPPPLGKADRREADPSRSSGEASQACLGERTIPTHHGRNGLGHAMKPLRRSAHNIGRTAADPCIVHGMVGSGSTTLSAAYQEPIPAVRSTCHIFAPPRPPVHHRSGTC